MGRIQYIVTEDHGQWFVEVQGQLYGRYESEEHATKDAVRGAGSARNTEVVVQGSLEEAPEVSGQIDVDEDT